MLHVQILWKAQQMSALDSQALLLPKPPVQFLKARIFSWQQLLIFGIYNPENVK